MEGATSKRQSGPEQSPVAKEGRGRVDDVAIQRIEDEVGGPKGAARFLPGTATILAAMHHPGGAGKDTAWVDWVDAHAYACLAGEVVVSDASIAWSTLERLQPAIAVGRNVGW